MENILSWSSLAGLATIIGCVVLFYQIKSSRSNARISTTNDLIKRYYRDYRDLRTSSTITDYADFEDDASVDTERGGFIKLSRYERNRRKKLDFYCELALYWKRDLIDKEIVKYHTKNEIVKVCSNLEIDYEDDSAYNSQLLDLMEMKDDMEKINSLEYRLEKLYKKMNIRK